MFPFVQRVSCFRSAFQSQATVHNNTVGRDRGAKTVRLSGPVILETLALFACLKFKQCLGESAYETAVET